MRYPPYGPRPIEMAHHHDGAWWWLGHTLGFVLMVGLIALLVIIAWRLLHAPVAAAPAASTTVTPAAPAADDAALGALRLRYANGEVTRDDYLRIASDLGASVPSPDSPSSPSSEGAA